MPLLKPPEPLIATRKFFVRIEEQVHAASWLFRHADFDSRKRSRHGSWLALIPAAGFVLTVLRRVRTEDGFLHKHLPGYADYAHRVPGALIRSRKQAVFDHAISGWESENG